MPSLGWGGESYCSAKARAVKEKLAKLGINPRSNKYDTLFFRWMRRA